MLESDSKGLLIKVMSYLNQLPLNVVTTKLYEVTSIIASGLVYKGREILLFIFGDSDVKTLFPRCTLSLES